MGMRIEIEHSIENERISTAINRCVRIKTAEDPQNIEEFWQLMQPWDIFFNHDILIGKGASHIWVSLRSGVRILKITTA